ncbi:MAG: adenosylcobinamide-GDP ribazoletransferase [Clostridia bacterium]|jgi:adenosylcobinamide-GDP ribazoletransferase
MNLLHRFMSTLSLVARFPVPLRSKPDYGAVDFFLPLVGLHAGLMACAGAFVGLAAFGPGLLAALCAMLAQYLAYNLFHFDGLLDTADAAGAFGDQEKRRAILKDPRIGAFAMFAGFMVLAAKAGALSDLFELARLELESSGSPGTGMTVGGVVAGGARASLLPWAALLMAPAAGRLAAIVVTLSCSPASSKGLAASLGTLSPVPAMLGFALAALPAAVLAGIIWGSLGAALSLLAGALVAMATGISVGLWYGRKVGGYNGDAMGAAVELGEVVVLLLALWVGRVV